jgi:hypothetical protein
MKPVLSTLVTVIFLYYYLMKEGHPFVRNTKLIQETKILNVPYYFPKIENDLPPLIFLHDQFKGTVQRKLTEVESDINQKVFLSH